jgi:glycosyltransferase involved in cell wall biosynthesis
VLFLIDSLGHGGAEHLLGAYLRHSPDLNVTAEVCALQERDGNPMAEPIRRLGVPVRTLAVTRLLRPDAYSQVNRAIDAAKPDVIHAQLEFATILGGLAARWRNIPMISTIHTIGKPDPLTRAALRFRTEAWALRRFADRVVAVSEFARRGYLADFGLSPGQVVTIHNGVDIERFRARPGMRTAARSELGIPPNVPLAITVAVLRRPKGIGDMLAAMPAALERIPDLHYLVVGEGPARHDLERLVSERGLDDRVILAGNRSDVPRMLAAADVFVLPSHTEALPTAVAEAMAAGLPVVATRVGGIPEMVDHETGILVEPGDPDSLAVAISDILAGADMGRSLGERGAQRAAHRFDIRRQTSQLVAEYRKLAPLGLHR